MDLNVPLPPMQFDFVNNTWEAFDHFLENVDTTLKPPLHTISASSQCYLSYTYTYTHFSPKHLICPVFFLSHFFLTFFLYSTTGPYPLRPNFQQTTLDTQKVRGFRVQVH